MLSFVIFTYASVYMKVCYMCACLQRPERLSDLDGGGLTGSCEPPDMGLATKLRVSEEQQVLLATESPHQLRCNL